LAIQNKFILSMRLGCCPRNGRYQLLPLNLGFCFIYFCFIYALPRAITAFPSLTFPMHSDAFCIISTKYTRRLPCLYAAIRIGNSAETWYVGYGNASLFNICGTNSQHVQQRLYH